MPFDFGVGYTELFVLAVIAVIVIGPKDLPKVLRGFGRMMTKMRGMAREFQGHVDVAMKQAGVDDIKKDFQAIKSGNIISTAKKEVAAAGNDFETYFNEPEAAAKPDVKASG